MSRLSSFNKVFNLKNEFDNINNTLSWKEDYKGRARCFVCDEMIQNKAVETIMGPLCHKCISLEFIDISEDYIDRDLSISDIENIFDKKDNISEQIITACNIEYYIDNISKTLNDEERNNFYRFISGLLSFKSGHILDIMIIDRITGAVLKRGINFMPFLIMPPDELSLFKIFAALKIDSQNKTLEKNILAFFKINKNSAERRVLFNEITNSDYIFPALKSRVSRELMNDSDSPIKDASIAYRSSHKEIREEKVLLHSKKEEFSPFELHIYNIFTHASLEKIYSGGLFRIIDESYFNCGENFSLSKIKKTELASSLYHVLSEKENFLTLYNSASDIFKKTLYSVIWDDSDPDILTIERTENISIISPGSVVTTGKAGEIEFIDGLFHLFSIKVLGGISGKKRVLISLDNEIKDKVKTYLPVPEFINLKPLKRVNKTEYTFSENDDFINNLESAYRLYPSLKFNKAGTKLTKASIKEFNSVVSIDEFYNNLKDSTLSFLRTELILEFIKNTVNEIFNPEKIKDTIFESYKKLNDRTIFNILDYLNVSSYNFERDKELFNDSILSLFSKLPSDEWVSIENIVFHFIHNDEYSKDIIDIENSDIYAICSSMSEWKDHERVFISKNNFKEMLLVPFLKAIFFMSASLELLDIAYDTPENELITVKKKPYLSSYDGLKYIRLNSFGSYIFKGESDFKLEIKKEEEKIIPDSTRLIILTKNISRLSEVSLEKFSEPMGAGGYYEVTEESFLKNCETSLDALNMITLFKETVNSENLPEIWNTFLDKVVSKSRILKEDHSSWKVFNLEKNREFITLINSNEELKQIVKKAEDYTILVKESDLEKFRTILKKEGFLI